MLFQHSPGNVLALLATAIVIAAPTPFAVANDGERIPPEAEQSIPHWIWSGHDRQGSEEAVLRTEFQLASAARRAHLKCIVDFCRVEVLLNGTPLLFVEDYAPIIDQEVDCAAGHGRNVLELRCRGSSGPSAVAISLTPITTDRSGPTIRTGPSWTVESADRSASNDGSGRQLKPVASFGTVARELLGISSVPVAIRAVDDYEQWKQALSEDDDAARSTFTLPDGFEIRRIRSAAPEEGSWVSMVFDPQGRLVIAREDQGLLRMTMSSDRRIVEQVETINDSLLECRGLAFHHGDLFTNANNTKALFRLRDTDGNDLPDAVTLIREFPGGVGHGRNDLAIGPEGRIHSIHGDAVDLPDDDVIDRTSPFRAARRGVRSTEGSLLRFSPDPDVWELVCAGLRNPFGVALHPDHGEPFTYDADAEHDMGAPWYRPTRIVHLRSGADYGWRGVTGTWPPYYPDHADNALPVVDIGKGSPTAVKFGMRSRFPRRWRRALFVLDWAYGRVIAVHLDPRGASYRAQSELFLRGRPLNVTDLDFGPDGAMYLVTGGRKTNSSLYRVAYVGDQGEPETPSQQQQARAEYSARARARRRQLERYHRPSGASAVEDALQELDQLDPALRHAARLAIEHQPVSTWQQNAIDETRTNASIAALTALLRSNRTNLFPQILRRLNELAVTQLTHTQRLEMLNAYSRCLIAPDDIPVELVTQCVHQLNRFYPASVVTTVLPTGMGGPIERDLSRLLVMLNAPGAVEKSISLMQASEPGPDRVHYLHILRSARNGWTPQTRRMYFTALNDATRFPGGRGLPGFLETIRADALATLTDDERENLADLLAAPTDGPDEPLPARPFVRKWALADLTTNLAELSQGRNFANGKQMFREALCSRCHRVGVDGSAMGPDLTSVGNRFSARDILESILKPSQIVAEPYRIHQLVLSDGRVFIGQVVMSGDYRSSSLKLMTDPLRPSRTIELAKQEIEHFEESATSPMPEGLLNTLNREDILDLMAYVSTGGNERHACFVSVK